MNKIDFLKASFANRAYNNKEYMVSLITIGFDDPENKAILSPLPYCVWIEENKYHFNDENKVEHILEGSVTEPVFMMDTLLSLPHEFHPVLDEDTETTFGIFLFNVVLFYETVGKLIPYLNKELTKDNIKPWISELMCDELPGVPIPEGKAGIKKVLQISRNANYLEGILVHIVKCGSQDSLTISPAILKRKAELIKEHKDHLTDPIVFNNIVEELVNMDMEIQKKGASNTFYISKDYISNCRKRMFMVFGIEFNSETGQWVPLLDPLTEGWDPNLLTDYINTTIEGSYNRGKATGEGGARVKDILRVMGSSHVSEEDCGSIVTEQIDIREYNRSQWVGAFILLANKPTLLTDELSKKLLGKTVDVRVPQFCLATDGNYCKICLGSGLGKYSTRLASDTVKVPTTFMLTRMKASHISGSSNAKMNLEYVFRT